MNTTENNKKTMDFFESMLDYFEELNHLQAKVGVHADAGQENVNKAKWNEFGTTHRLKYRSVGIMGQGLKPLTKTRQQYVIGDNKNVLGQGADISIPARPFIRLFLYPDLVDKLVKDTMDYIDVVFNKKKIKINDARDTYKRMGITSVDLMRSKMEYRNFDKNSNNTIYKDQEHNSEFTQKYIKGKDMPLFDTGELYDVIDYKVRKRRS